MTGYGMLALFATAFITLAVFYFARSWAHRATLVVVGKVSIRLAERLTGLVEKLVDGLHVFGRVNDAFGFFVETSLYWTINAVGMWMLAWGCGASCTRMVRAPRLGEAFGLMGTLGCAILDPRASPGMAGGISGRHLTPE